MKVDWLDLKRYIVLALFICAVITIFAASLIAQSTDQSFPTPVRANEISGIIKARDIGDSRLTTHYYTFDGSQGDLFVNIQTSNFSGDIDVYIVPGLKPLSKIVIYSDISVAETGRVLYLRKNETMLLRVQGRTPGDDDASYRIKFAGSFMASKAADSEMPELPKVTTETPTNVRVNSVGTILEVIPKPTPTPKEAEVADAETKQSETEEKTEKQKTEAAENAKPEVIVSDPLADKPKETAIKTPAKAPARRRSRTVRPPKATETKTDPQTDPEPETAAKEKAVDEKPKPPARRSARVKTPKPPVEEPVDPMANVRLVIRFKDGSTIERPMTEVFKFTVERAILTVISKDGSIGRYKMIEVAGVTIE